MNFAAQQIVDRHLARHPNHILPGSRTDAGVHPVAGTLANAITASLLPFRDKGSTSINFLTVLPPLKTTTPRDGTAQQQEAVFATLATNPILFVRRATTQVSYSSATERG